MERFIKGQDRKNIYCKKWDNKPVNGKEVLPFWIADSDYPTYEKITDKLIERVKNATFGYTYIDDDYYNNVINWFNRRYGYKIEKENVFPTHGVLVGLTYAVHLFTKPGDKIVCSTPVYNPFFSIVKDNGRELVFNKLVETKNENNEYTYVYDFADLEEKIKDEIEIKEEREELVEEIELNKETELDINDKTLEHDLFNLIDSMYEGREDK